MKRCGLEAPTSQPILAETMVKRLPLAKISRGRKTVGCRHLTEPDPTPPLGAGQGRPTCSENDARQVPIEYPEANLQYGFQYPRKQPLVARSIMDAAALLRLGAANGFLIAAFESAGVITSLTINIPLRSN